ncbi:hypothetical protein, partial [Escherichia coli]|uniref:hypothetical protein n=1 Tax=Escherichia coli TaxID=562 RepID=UPI00195FF384
MRFFVSAKDDGEDHRPKKPRSDPRKLVASGSSKGIDKDVELDALERLALAAVKLGRESVFINLEHDG